MLNSKISLSIRIVQDNEKSETTYLADGKFAVKDGIFNLSFDEENVEDNGITKCRFEISDDTLLMKRNGPVVVEQTHATGKRTPGVIKTPFGRMDTEIETTHFTFTEKSPSEYQLHLSYDLYIGMERAGVYNLDLNVQLNNE